MYHSNEETEALIAENHLLQNDLDQIKKSFERYKDLHRKFVEDTIESEKLRIDDYNKLKKSLSDDISSLRSENNRIKKDLSFYKKCCQEFNKEDDQLRKKSPRNDVSIIKSNQDKFNQKDEIPIIKRVTRSSTSDTRTPEPQIESNLCSNKNQYRSNNPKVFFKINEKLFEENKKLKLKISVLTKDNNLLRTKNKQLDNFKNKINDKKKILNQKLDELDKLASLNEQKNGEKFSQNVLDELGKLSKC